MSALPGSSDFLGEVDTEHPRLQQRPLSQAERRARWEVHAAQWRARELADAVFGSVTDMQLSGLRADGLVRGLLRLDVPFIDLEVHRDREARFLAAVASDQLLTQIPLLYVIGPDSV